MNTNQPNQPQTSTTQPTNTPPTTQIPTPTPKTKKPWLLISLVVLLFSATGVLGYKYYEVKQQLDNQQPIPLPSPQLIVNSPLPAVSPAAEVDPMEEWKTYTNDEYNFSFKYPTNWQFTDYEGGKVVSGDQPQLVTSVYNKSSSETIALADKSRVEFGVVYYKPNNFNNFIPQFVDKEGLKPDAQITNKYFKQYPDRLHITFFIANQKSGEIFQLSITTLNDNAVKNWEDIFDQYISTFKLIN